MANKDDIYPGCPGDCSPTYVRELQKAAAQADLQARAREIAAGLTESQRWTVHHGSDGRRVRVFNRSTGSALIRRELATVDPACTSRLLLTDLGRAVAAVLAEGGEVDRG